MSSDQTATGLYAQAELAPGSVLAGRFRVEKLLGVGGMGVVYRATDQALDVPVAIKLLRPELATRPEAFERFRQELLLARQVSNPHVVRIHDLAQHEGRWLISMDYVDGEALDKRLDRDGRLAIDDALKIVRQVAEGLGAAHARDVVHRDLKPANVLIDRDGNAYISDFGVARSLATSGLTHSGSVIGTPDYLSPEQARGEAVDPRSDLYALGLILYEMLAGAPPFAGGTVAEILAQRMLKTPAPVTQARPDAPSWVARLVDRLLRPQPAHRLQSAADVVAAIDRRDVPRLPWSERLRPGRSAWIGLAAAFALAVGGIAWWQLRERDAPVTAAVPSLQRILVLPIERRGGEATLDDRFAGLSAHLRDALAARMAVVDGERTDQAMRQLDPTGQAPPDPGALRRVAAADRVLQPRLIAEGGRWRLQADLHAGNADGARIDGAAAADPVSALRAGLPALAAAMDLQAREIDLALPAHAAALDAYGAAWRGQRRGLAASALAALRRATQAEPGYAAAWLALAETARTAGEDEIAYDAVEHGQRVAATPKPLQARLKALRALLDGDAPIAVAEWRTLSTAVPDDGFAALNLARAQGAAGDLDAAIAGLRALVARDENDPRAWFELGKFSIMQGDARPAVDEYLLRALLLYRRGRDDYGQGETLNALGVGYGRLGQTEDAEEQYRKAVELRRRVGNRRGVATSLRNLASLTSMRGDFKQAAVYLDEARALYTTLGDRQGLAATENESGLLAEERGDYRAALEAFRRALSARQQVGDTHGTAETLNDIGFAHYQLGDYDSAQAFWQQATEAYGKLGDATGAVRIAQNLGLLAIARGHWDEARQRLDRSLADAEKQQMLQEVAVSRRNLAELELSQGHLRAALDQIERAEALFRQHEDQRSLIDVGLLRAQVQLAAHAGAAAQQTLDALQPMLAEASNEQRAIAAATRAELAQRAGDAGRASDALVEARRLAASAGVRQLQLQIDLLSAQLRPGDTAALDAATTALGHAGLRLAFLELALSRRIEAGDGAGATRLYRQAQALLRNGDNLYAPRLHALGAQALAANGDAAGAANARRAARQALEVLRAQVPDAMRTGFDAAPGVAHLAKSPPPDRPER